MIKVIFDRMDFEYEISALIRSIFPGEHISSEEASGTVREAVRILAHTDGQKKACASDMHEYKVYERANISVSGDKKTDGRSDIHACRDIISIFISLSDTGFKIIVSDGIRCISSDITVFVRGEKNTGEELCSIKKNKDGKKNPFRLEYKNRLKSELLKVLTYNDIFTEHKRNIPEWGTLTGVRPAKTAAGILERLKNNEKSLNDNKSKYMSAAVHEFEDIYLVSHDKAELAVSVAQHELDVLDSVSSDGYSLYIGIPFCPGRCIYCSFAAVDGDKYIDRMEPYLECLEHEMKASARICGKSPKTIYIGGGTPTELSDMLFKKLLDITDKIFDTDAASEYTVEAGRPDTISSFKLHEMIDHGVTRISINPQTMKNETLELIGRRHTAEDIVNCFQEASSFGFTDINMDLIAGLPGEDMNDFIRSVEKIAELHPSCITVHSLVIKRSSRLRGMLDNISVDKDTAGENVYADGLRNYKITGNKAGSDIAESRDSLMAAMTDEAHKRLEKRGYMPYYMYRQKNADTYSGNSGQENIGFCRPGHECLYNILMMEEKQSIISVGAGASSKLYIPEKKIVKRVENVKNVDEYIKRTDEMITRKRKLFLGT